MNAFTEQIIHTVLSLQHLTNNLLIGKSWMRGPSASQTVSITFDDGPHPIYTVEILRHLKTFGAKATFFVVGKNAEQYPEIIRQIDEEGHEIGIHGWSHANLTQCSIGMVAKEIDQTSTLIYELTGKKPKCFRPPYGARNRKIMRCTRDSNLNVVMWSLNSRDWRESSANIMFERLEKIITNGSVLLMHDSSELGAHIDRQPTVDLVNLLLFKNSRKNNVQFVTCSQLFDF